MLARQRRIALPLIVWALFTTSCTAHAWAHGNDDLVVGRAALHSLAGCYLVDYSYVETQSLLPGYSRDERVYDVNNHRSVMEWISVADLSATRVWMQHILMMPSMQVVMKHESEDWTYDAPSLYEFVGPDTWQRRTVTPGQWTRRITNLDDGPRYQCAAQWQQSQETGYPEWSCATYAPIPGRETRDMQRSDYNTLQRTSRLVAYGSSWLERQNNIKTRHYGDGKRESLVRELGKNWYVRLPDSACADVHAFVAAHQAFWEVVRSVWDSYFIDAPSFVEKHPANTPPRYVRMAEVEEAFVGQDLLNANVRASAEAAVRAVIDAYR